MLECLIVGDSIAVGVSQVRPECSSIAKSGINSGNWNKQHLHKLKPARTLVISLGANDVRGHNTEGNIRLLRTNAQADRVFWLLPNETLKPAAVAAVRQVALDFGDTVIERPKTNMSADRVHPTGRGYKILGDQTR
jgi:lysophospholipase L1-like esterase